MKARGIQVRELRAGDLDLLERYLPSEDEAKYRKRLAEQEAGTITYLIAWKGNKPLGHGFLRWKPDDPVGAQFPGVPSIGDLGTRPELQSRGIGTRLMESLEALAGERGCSRVALGVGVDNYAARRLYERRGYVDTGVPPHPAVWSFVDREGRFRTYEEICIYMVKALG